MNKKNRKNRRLRLLILVLIGNMSEIAEADEEIDASLLMDHENQLQDLESDTWTETYTYRSDTQEPHAVAEKIEKEGLRYTLKDVQYQVTELTNQLLQKSEAMWSSVSYEPEQEFDDNGIHYSLTSVSREEWVQEQRTQTVTQYRSYFEGQEVPESLDIEIQDEVTGETVSGTISKIDFYEDGAAWQEGSLEQWEMYCWDGSSWIFEEDGKSFYATEESPWFEGCEDVLLQDLHLEKAFNQITSVEWYGDGWQDEDGNWKRSARISGKRMIPRYQAVYSGSIEEAELPMVCYTAHYTSEPQGYLVEVTATYELENQSIQPETQNVASFEKSWYLLLAVLAAASVGLQVAAIFVLASKKNKKSS